MNGVIAGKPFQVILPAKVSTIAASPENLVAIGTTDELYTHHAVQLYRAPGIPVGVPMKHRDGIICVTFAHSAHLLASCSEDFTAQIWDLNGKEVSPPLHHKHHVRWAAFNETDEWLATGSHDETVRIWSVRTGTPVTPPLRIGNIVDWLEFNSKNELLVANSKRTYRLTLPFFQGDPRDLLNSRPGPVELLREAQP